MAAEYPTMADDDLPVLREAIAASRGRAYRRANGGARPEPYPGHRDPFATPLSVEVGFFRPCSVHPVEPAPERTVPAPRVMSASPERDRPLPGRHRRAAPVA